MSYEVRIRVLWPCSNPYAKDDVRQKAFVEWSEELVTFVETLKNARAVPVYKQDWDRRYGRSTVTAYVDVLTDRDQPAYWRDAFNYAMVKVSKLEAARYDIDTVEVEPFYENVALGGSCQDTFDRSNTWQVT